MANAAIWFKKPKNDFNSVVFTDILLKLGVIEERAIHSTYWENVIFKVQPKWLKRCYYSI